MDKKKILILGASGFIGNALYKELCPYFDTYGTYNNARRSFEDNKQFSRYDLQEDDVVQLLKRIKPQVIISALRGSFPSQILAHEHIVEYVQEHHCRLYFISSANVFDGYRKFPSYEYDKTFSDSVYGRFKIKIENMLMRLPEDKYGILRVPMIFGNSSPRVKEMKSFIWANEAIEVFPNLVINITNDDRLTQQVHYLVNQDLGGIFHLGSKDLVHHDDLIREIVERIGSFNPIYKRVYTSNEERYLAVLPKDRLLPSNLQITYQDIIDHHILK